MDDNRQDQRVGGRNMEKQPQFQQSAIGIMKIDIVFGLDEFAQARQVGFAGVIKLSFYGVKLAVQARDRNFGRLQVSPNVAGTGEKISENLSIKLGNAQGLAVLH